MKTIDNRIKYYELLMNYDDTSKYINYELPEGYHYEFYKSGDEEAWINIHILSGEFTSFEKGLQYFHEFYDSFIDKLDKRCFFIVDDDTSEKIGTATISLLKNEEYGYKAAVDWLAINKDYQGKKLSRPLISKIISLAHELGHDKIILHTQTTTWLAAKLYLDAGFDNIYGTDNYNYSVWYKNDLHNVYVYSNGNSYEYEYFEEDDKIRLEKIDKKGSE